jgi:hypothetical protein
VLHCDPETLALRSLGEVVGTPEDDTHLAGCGECQSELAALRAVVATARDGGPVEMHQPSDHVWGRIQTQLNLSALPGDAPVQVPVNESTPQPTDGPADEPTNTPPERNVDVADVVDLSQRRSRRARPAPWLLAAAGIGGIVVGGVATAAVVAPSSSGSDVTVAASVDLAPLPEWDASGSAELGVTADGQQVLTVSVSADEQSEGYREVWLIDSDVDGMVSLGILDGASSEFVIPDGVVVGDFPIVDVSLEPFDGDPTHSGDSIVRGQIEA